MSDFTPFTIERPWGSFRQLTLNSPSTVKVHKVKPNEETSWQSHTKRSEFWYFIEGDGEVHIDDKIFKISPGAEYTAPVGAKHRWIAGPSGMLLVEVATGEFDEEDITRYEDKYGRA
ncbi:MAG: phosphomannose isomerase type II C-terminal cupin domain [Patescibacteria group bacterium]